MQTTKKLVFQKSYTTSENITADSVSSEEFISQADQDKHMKWGGFTDILVLNSDSVNLGIRFNANPDTQAPVPKSNGGISLDGQNFSHFTIKNLDGATDHTAGTIYILVQKFILVDIETGEQYTMQGEHIGRVY